MIRTIVNFTASLTTIIGECLFNGLLGALTIIWFAGLVSFLPITIWMLDAHILLQIGLTLFFVVPLVFYFLPEVIELWEQAKQGKGERENEGI